jgi:hypothetical protein
VHAEHVGARRPIAIVIGSRAEKEHDFFAFAEIGRADHHRLIAPQRAARHAELHDVAPAALEIFEHLHRDEPFHAPPVTLTRFHPHNPSMRDRAGFHRQLREVRRHDNRRADTHRGRAGDGAAQQKDER